MSVQVVSGASPVQNASNKNKKFSPVKITGYGALGFGIASGIAAGGFRKVKIHKYFAYVSGILALVHTVLVELHHRKK